MVLLLNRFDVTLSAASVIFLDRTTFTRCSAPSLSASSPRKFTVVQVPRFIKRPQGAVPVEPERLHTELKVPVVPVGLLAIVFPVAEDTKSELVPQPMNIGKYAPTVAKLFETA